ncbi:hypothetical protein Pint_35022 [Pistacia integerrima]|uniref:Uncharacterized protein n=1 Tax=Pistacia integerrima TaxID=434235 RepID=A0ACC0Y369_9ROSI|nr:hypothetical protein Pint_35022 [Pistacia integerrima]
MADQCNSRGVLGEIDLNILPILEAMDEVDDITEKVNTHVSRKNLTNEQRQAIFESLLKRSVNGQLKKNITSEVAQLFSVSMRTVQRIWQRGKENEVLDSSTNVSSRKALNCGRKRLEIDVSQFRNIPLRRRTSLRSLSAVTNLSVTTLFRRLKEGSIRRHSSAIKPLLNVENMKARIRFCLSMIEHGNNPSCLRFVTMENIIHVDEKWFYMTKQSEKYYLLADEDEPLRTCKSKTFITKVMFLAAVTRPRFDESGNELFSGKIGIFPFINKEPARRSSKNRSDETMETKTINSINKEIYRSYIIEKLLPLSEISGQELMREVQYLSNKTMRNLILVWMMSIFKGLQYQQAPNSIDALIEAVQRSYEEQPAKKKPKKRKSMEQGLEGLLNRLSESNVESSP